MLEQHLPRRAVERARAQDRTALARSLESFGLQFLREVSAPTVVAVFRLAIAEAERAPAVARALDEIGREASRSALRKLLEQASTGALCARRNACDQDCSRCCQPRHIMPTDPGQSRKHY